MNDGEGGEGISGWLAGVVRCGAVRCGAVRCGVVWYGMGTRASDTYSGTRRKM